MGVTQTVRDERIVIIGAGPTGLGAAFRLHQLGYRNFSVFEKEAYTGGLAASFTDDNGFTWDVGGHVQFSHYTYFDDLMESLLPGEWLHHLRESWIWIRDRFVPYPFQNNIRHLPRTEMLECLSGLIDLSQRRDARSPENFEEWIRLSFGEGIARLFMLPYNFKVWAYPAAGLGYGWIGERVAQVDLKRVVLNVIEDRDDTGWGPNNTFRFPARGGTGAIWSRLASRLPSGAITLNKPLRRLLATRRQLEFADGTREEYDLLVSTMPLDLLVENSDLEELKPAARRLRHSTTHVIGVGLRGTPPPHVEKMCWMYFPEDAFPFYRATVFSNYSPNNVPAGGAFWSLMLEVAESPVKPVDRGGLVDSCIASLLAGGFIGKATDVVDTWHMAAPRGYPTPALDRDACLGVLLPALEEFGIFSRGRFGAWKYEVSNQDHSLMQGVELVNRLVEGAPEMTLVHPHVVNKCAAGGLK